MNALDERLRGRLYKFQIECIEFGLRNLGRILIGDEMGVGKTVESLALASCYHSKDTSCWPLLIICPSSLRLNWRDEALKWLPTLGSH